MRKSRYSLNFGGYPLKGIIRKGFTLAEVLITLGIIGVVAAMTIPNLITNYQKKQTVVKLQKGISTMAQTVKLVEEEYGAMENWDVSLSHLDFIDMYFRPFTKIMLTCDPITKCGYTPVNNNVWMQANGVYDYYGNPNHGGRVPFMVMDGFVYTFSHYAPNSSFINEKNHRVIIIDINGSKKPNRIGRDVFFLYRDVEANSIIPYGADMSKEEIKKDCSKTGRGLTCAAMIRDYGWDIPKNYPWK